MKEKIYKLTKTGRGFSHVFYIKTKEKVTEEMLENIGENTDGGHECGYRITAKCIKKIPKGEKYLSKRQTIQVYR